MPATIETPAGTFYRTHHQGVTLAACAFGAGHRTTEYWLEGEDACRLHRLDDGRHFID